MSNVHYDKMLDFQKSIKKYLKNIFQVYGMELELRLEELSLLDNKRNCLESSTAIGFVLEEFIVSKLEIYTRCFKEGEGFLIRRREGPTAQSSYDCYGTNDDIMIMINIKSSKGDDKNNPAIASINRMVYDYVTTNPKQKKAFMVLKVSYDIDLSKNPLTPHRKILINGISSFFIDEIDFRTEHRQDHRSWARNEANPNSGRLQVTDSFRASHRLDPDTISYENTCEMLNNLVSRNINGDTTE